MFLLLLVHVVLVSLALSEQEPGYIIIYFTIAHRLYDYCPIKLSSLLRIKSGSVICKIDS